MNKPSYVSIDLQGNPILSHEKDLEETTNSLKKIGDKSHVYYRKELNSLLGPNGLIGLYDFLSNGAMWFSTAGVAPLTNTFVSLAEYLQVVVANTNLLGDPEDHSESGEIARQRRVGAMAWTQVLAGAGGLVAFLTNLFSPETERNISGVKKAGLSGSMLAGAGLLYTTFAEKMLVITTSKCKQVGNESKAIFLDARNDLRAIPEYLVMAFYPWIKSIKPLQYGIDFTVPILALRDGLESFVTDGLNWVFSNEKSKMLPESVRKNLRTLLFLSEAQDTNTTLPAILQGGSYLNGFRNNVVVKLFKGIGCKNIPEIKLKNESGQRSLQIAA